MAKAATSARGKTAADTEDNGGQSETGKPADSGDLAELKDAGTGQEGGTAGDGVTAPEEGDDAGDRECAEARNIETAAEGFRFDDPYFAVGDCRDAMLTVIRQTVDMTRMREHAQREIIAAISNAAVEIVTKVSRTIASQGVENIPLTLEKLVVKDGLQLTLKGVYTHDALTLLGDAQGKQILVSLPDSARFDHVRAAVAITPDRPELPLAGPEGDGDLAAAGEPVGNRELYREPHPIEGEPGPIKVRHRDTGVDLGQPTDDEVTAFEAHERALLAAAEAGTLPDGDIVNLKTGMVERKVGEDANGPRYEELREATPTELAAAREAQADFPAE